MPDNPFAAWELDLLAAGALTIPGRSRQSVASKRTQMKKPKPPKAWEQFNQAQTTDALFAECSHMFAELSRQAFSATFDRPQYAASQVRVCQRCGCSQVRLWTVNGYATRWHQPQMPMGDER